MNKLILIGNGFDLAHEFPTSYNNFIDDFWQGKIDLLTKKVGARYEDNHIKLSLVPSSWNIGKNPLERINSTCTSLGISFTIKNSFLEFISNNYLKNWLDIEALYYKQLTSRLTLNLPSEVISLNKKFKEVEDLLIDYLNKIQETKINTFSNSKIKSIISGIIFEPIRPRDLSIMEFSSLVTTIWDEFRNYANNSNEMPDNIKRLSERIYAKNDFVEFKDLLNSGYAEIFVDNLTKDRLSISFNYTDTANLYEGNYYKKCDVINIHAL